MDPGRRDEAFAFEVVGHLLGVKVDPYDCGGRQNAADAVLRYGDGRDAVLEVSSIGDEDEAKIRGELNQKSYRTVAGLKKVWHVEVPANFAPKGLDVRKELSLVDTMLLHCEELGIDQFPSQQLIGDDRARALWARAVTAIVVRTSTSVSAPEPRAYVVVRGVGGSGSQGVEQLGTELLRCLNSKKMQSKITKLAKPLDDEQPRDERHLFLLVRPTAFIFPVYNVLASDGPLPGGKPALPDGVSQVWLATEIAAGGIVRAIAGVGWRRDPAWPSLWQRQPT